jgi:signal peptidase II
MKLGRATLLGSCSRLLTLILLTAGLFGCDYASKSAAKATLEGIEAVPVAPAVLRGAVELRYVENDDIAFNALRTLGVPRSPALLAAIASLTILALVVGAYLARRRRAQQALARGEASSDSGATGGSSMAGDAAVDRWMQAGLVLTIGGALGNLVDRIARGYVVDFIHVKGWPVFNVADIAIVVGIGLILLARTGQQKEGGLRPSPPA